MNILKQIGQIWNQYREFRSTFNELSQMSDAELRDMGLTAAISSALHMAKRKPGSTPVVTARRQTKQTTQGSFGVLRESH